MMTRRDLLSLGVTGAVLLAMPAAFAQSAPGAAQATGFVQSLGNQLTAVVNGPGSVAQKRPQLTPLIEQAVDVNGIAQFCLGRFWRTATPAQRQQYTQLFHAVLFNSIIGHLGQFKGLSFAMTQTVQREGVTLVGTRITRPDQAPATVQWVVDDVGGRPKIVDVVAEGTSLRLTQRSDYASYLSRHGGNVDALITAMRRQVGA